jgi:hypothetical protein
MTCQDERVALLARYLAAWRWSEVARRRYQEYERDLFGADAVRALDAHDALVAAGVAAKDDVRGWRLPVDLSRPPTPEQVETAWRLVHEANEAGAMRRAALVGIWRARVRDGYPPEAIDFYELLVWAGVDMTGLERMVSPT